MPKMYEIKSSCNDDGDFVWELFETSSENIVGTFFFEEDAKTTRKFYANGGAFNGFTPAFMVSQPYKPSNLDEEFSSFVE